MTGKSEISPCSVMKSLHSVDDSLDPLRKVAVKGFGGGPKVRTFRPGRSAVMRRPILSGGFSGLKPKLLINGHHQNCSVENFEALLQEAFSLKKRGPPEHQSDYSDSGNGGTVPPVLKRSNPAAPSISGRVW